MRSHFLVMIILTGLVSAAQNQADLNNHTKYWYYKWRLNNQFARVGAGNGYSIPARLRSQAGALTWSDGGPESKTGQI